MARKKIKREPKIFPWENLPDSMKAEYTPDEWVAAIRLDRENEKADRPRRPADWVEPSLTLAEAEADPFCWSQAAWMRNAGETSVTRSTWIGAAPNKVPRGWTQEDESNLVDQLQDRYWSYERYLDDDD